MSIFPSKTSSAFNPTPHPSGALSRLSGTNVEGEILSMSRYDYSTEHVKVTWSKEPGLQVNLDPALVAQPLAEAGARVVSAAIAGITRTIKPNTRRYRATAARAYAAGKPWALERYKARPPGAANSDRLWNDSGTMAADVQAQLDATNTWAIVTPVEGVRNQFVVRALLKRDIPELRSAKQLQANAQVKAALGDVARIAISRPTKRTSAFGKVSLGRRSAVRK